MRHDPHQAEDQREAACDDEKKAGEREPVQERPDEALPVVDRRSERRRAPVAADVRRRLGQHDDVEQCSENEQGDHEPGEHPADVNLSETVSHAGTNLPSDRDGFN